MSTHKPPGLTYIPSFILPDTAKCIVSTVDSLDWQTSLRRRVQHYGWRYDYKSRRIDQGDWLGPLPDFALPILERLTQARIFASPPDQLIVNEYMAGQGIAAHIDCEPCFGGTVASLSLNSPSTMRLRNRKSGLLYDIDLAPQSLLVLNGEARYEWTHEIAARKNDLIDGQRRPRGRRISLTFRNVIVQRTKPLSSIEDRKITEPDYMADEKVQ